MRTLLALAVLAPVLLLSGCGAGPRQASEADTSAITLAVGGVIQAFDAAIAARDTAAIDSLYSDDAVLLPASMPRVDGRAAIHRWWAAGLAAPDLRLVLVPVHTTVARAGDMATVVGTYDYRSAGPKGGAVREVGKWVNVLKPEGGRWQVVLDIWNSDQPSPPPGK